MKKIILGLAFVTSLGQSGEWSQPNRLTYVGVEKNRNYDATEPAVAFNTNQNKYLIVWEGNNQAANLATDEVEIFGKLLNAENDEVVTDTFRVSFNGSNLSNKYHARQPEVVYNADANEFVVVWFGDDNKNGMVEGEFEIFAQRINAADGSLIGNTKRVSDMGPTANRSYDALNPHISYNSQDNLYLVVWHGEEGSAASPLGSFEIYGQLLDTNLNEKGNNDFVISNMGPANSDDYNAFSPVASYNSTENEFLVVWYGEDDRDGRVPDEYEIYARRVNAQTGQLLGGDSTSVSYIGLNGDIARAAKYPDVSYNSLLNEYLVVWSADDSKNGHVGNEFEIYGQVLDSNAVEKGKNDFIISEMGPIGSNSFDAFRPKVEFSPLTNQYVVVWRGDDAVDGEFEIFTQRLDAESQVRLGKTSERLSFAGVEGSLLYDARRADIAFNTESGQFIAVWEQEDSTENQLEGEFEIFSSQWSDSEFVLNSSMTGSWYDSGRSGEGYILQMLPNDNVLIVWFTYLPDIADQAWILGVGKKYQNRVVFKNLNITHGGIFGEAFNPDDVEVVTWGDISVEFDGCNNGIINYESGMFDYGFGHHSFNRLTSVNGFECGATEQSDDIYNWLTGSWYDPSHSGEGWMMEYLGNNRVLMYWFSYDDVGNQKWFLSVGNIDEFGLIQFNEVSITDGTYFGDEFSSDSVNVLPWGSVQMQINHCNSISVIYSSGISIFGQGELLAKKLSVIDGQQCNL